MNTGLYSLAERGAQWLRWSVLVMVTIFPLVLFPGVERPFSTPKIFLLEGFVVVAGVFAVSLKALSRPSLPGGFLVALIGWAMASVLSAVFGEFFSPQALLLSLFCIGWFLLIVALRSQAIFLATAMSLSCTAVAGILLLQYFGLDPFRLLGWTTHPQGGPRMRLVATLGNPNFAAALIVSGLPLVLALGKIYQRQMLSYFVFVMDLLAMFATGSKAGMLAVAASLLWLGGLRGSSRRRGWIAVGALMAIALSAAMPSRSLLTTIEGRFYIWRVTASHLLERPFSGFGPGAFEPKFIEWETRYWQERHGADDERKFAQLQAHAHNDYLETMVDSGPVGLLALMSLLLSFFIFAFRQAQGNGNELVAGASAGVISLVAVALVDFPLHRPAELFMFWTLMGVVFLACPQRQVPEYKEFKRGQ